MSVFNMTFQIGDIGRALDVNPATLRTQVNRGFLVGHRQVEGGGGPGHHRTFTWFNLMEFAVAQELLRVTSLSPKAAFELAAQFAHFADGPVPGAENTRLPGLPFQPPIMTLLLVAGEKGEVFPYDPESDGNLIAYVERRFRRVPGFSVVFLDTLFDDVCRGLGLHPSAVLDQAYGSGEAEAGPQEV